MFRDLRNALGFLTVLPVGGGPPSGRAMAAFPLVGAFVGGALLCARWASGKLVPHPLSEVFLVGFWAWLTGGLHLDGLADACDALLAPLSPERRLEVLKDPHIGAFGTAGVALVLMAKAAGLYAVRGDWRTLFLAPMLARWAMVLVASSYPSARSEGLGRTFQRDAGKREVLWASAWAVAGVAVAGVVGLWTAASVGLFALAFARFVLKRIPGFTGDLYGALGELSEVLVLTVGAALEG